MALLRKFGLLFWFSIAFAIMSIAIVAIGTVIQIVNTDGQGFVEFNILSAPAILIIIGVILFFIAILGCCGSLAESYNLIMTFAIFLSVILVLCISGVIASYVKRGELQSILEVSFNDTFTRYPTNKEIEKTWDLMQHDLECCGINSSDDWKKVFGNDTIPVSCCAEISTDAISGAFVCNKTDAYKEGCFTLLLDSLHTSLSIIGAVALIVAILTFVTILYSCCIAQSIKMEYQTV